MFLYIARHAWAHEFGDSRWPDDSQRELESGGTQRYRQVIETLAERGFEPEAIVTSPYVRCRQTADLISQHTVHHPEITALDALAPGSDFQALIDWTKKVDCEQVCWVGHAPDVGNLTAALIGDSHAHIRFAKGAIAAIRYDSSFGLGPGCGELVWHVTAKSLGM